MFVPSVGTRMFFAAAVALLVCAALLGGVHARLQPGDRLERNSQVPTAAHVPFDGSERARAHGLHYNPRAHVLEQIGDKHEIVRPVRLTSNAARHQLKVNAMGTPVHPDRYEFKFTGQWLSAY
jgi:hypothetical protein